MVEKEEENVVAEKRGEENKLKENVAEKVRKKDEKLKKNKLLIRFIS